MGGSNRFNGYWKMGICMRVMKDEVGSEDMGMTYIKDVRCEWCWI